MDWYPIFKHVHLVNHWFHDQAWNSFFEEKKTDVYHILPSTNPNWLVVYLPLWKMMEFVSWDDDSIPNCFWKVIIQSCSKPPSSKIMGSVTDVYCRFTSSEALRLFRSTTNSEPCLWSLGELTAARMKIKGQEAQNSPYFIGSSEDQWNINSECIRFRFSQQSIQLHIFWIFTCVYNSSDRFHQAELDFTRAKKWEANGKIAVGNNNTDCQGGFNHFKSEISLWQTWIKWNLMESIYLF